MATKLLLTRLQSWELQLQIVYKIVLQYQEKEEEQEEKLDDSVSLNKLVRPTTVSTLARRVHFILWFCFHRMGKPIPYLRRQNLLQLNISLMSYRPNVRLPTGFSTYSENTHNGGSITVQLTSCLTGLDVTKQVNLLFIQLKQSNQEVSSTVKLPLMSVTYLITQNSVWVCFRSFECDSCWKGKVSKCASQKL